MHFSSGAQHSSDDGRGIPHPTLQDGGCGMPRNLIRMALEFPIKCKTYLWRALLSILSTTHGNTHV